MHQKPGVPYDAVDGHDFVVRLSKNHYWGVPTAANTAAYEAAMKGAAGRINLIGDLVEDNNQKIVTPSNGFVDWIKDHPIPLAAAGVGVALLLFRHR
jgi:hypothetical protein